MQGHEVSGTRPPTHPQFGGVPGVLPFSWMKGSGGGRSHGTFRGWEAELEPWTPRSPAPAKITRSLQTAAAAGSVLPVPQAPSSHLEVSPPDIICHLRGTWGGMKGGMEPASGLAPVQAGAHPSAALGAGEWGGGWRTGRAQSPLCCEVAGLSGVRRALAWPAPPPPSWSCGDCGFWEPVSRRSWKRAGAAGVCRGAEFSAGNSCPDLPAPLVLVGEGGAGPLSFKEFKEAVRSFPWG